MQFIEEQCTFVNNSLIFRNIYNINNNNNIQRSKKQKINLNTLPQKNNKKNIKSEKREIMEFLENQIKEKINKFENNKNNKKKNIFLLSATIFLISKKTYFILIPKSELNSNLNLNIKFIENNVLNKGGFSVIYELYNSKKEKTNLILKYTNPDKKNIIDIELKTYIFHFCLQSYLEEKKSDDLKYICKILEYGKILINDNPSNYCIMENCGKNLNKLNEKIKYNKNTKIDDINNLIKIFIKCCNSVNMLHKIGYIHNDIKESNFLFYEDNTNEIQIKIIDFGNIKKEGEKIDKKIIFTPGYVYPLIFEKNNNLKMNVNFDIFSLVITFLNILLRFFNLKSYIHYTNIYDKKCNFIFSDYYQLFTDKELLKLLKISIKENINNKINNKNKLNIIEFIGKIIEKLFLIIDNSFNNYNINLLIVDLNNI